MNNTKTTITIDRDLSKQIKLAATMMDMTMSEYVRYMFKQVEGK